MPDRLRIAAGLQGCQLYRYHRPVVVRTDHHHTHPQYLQLRLWGDVRDGPDLWVCGNCHAAIHSVIGWLLEESHKPNPMPGRAVIKAAQATVDWYRSTAAAIEPPTV